MLLRHAKSSWSTGHADRDRPLAVRGREAAPVMGRHLSESLPPPDLVLVSPARRTVETWELVAPMLTPRPPVKTEPRIYEAPWRRLADIVRETEGEVGTLLMIGHNPGFEDLAARLSGGGEPSALARLRQKYPTAGLAVIEIPIKDWADLAEGAGHLTAFVTPASLGEGPDE
jgi:phosphohistidine phosphatase